MLGAFVVGAKVVGATVVAGAEVEMLITTSPGVVDKLNIVLLGSSCATGPNQRYVEFIMPRPTSRALKFDSVAKIV